MADEEQAPRSLAERIAALNMSQVGKNPSLHQPAADSTVKKVDVARPRPPPPPRPSLPARPQSTNVPPASGPVSTTNGVGNVPAPSRPSMTVNSNGTASARPALPSRTSTQSNRSVSGPALPPRRPSDQPSLPPRRPSEVPSVPEYDRSRRTSIESVSSVATTRSSISGISNTTSLTSFSDRQRVKAPEYDPSALPALPPNRTKEEKEADARRYSGLRPLRPTKSTPRIQQVSEGTTPPPSIRKAIVPPPTLPNRSSAVREDQKPSTPPLPVRSQPALPARPRPSALTGGFGQNASPPLPGPRPGSVPQLESDAPPIPTSMKPDLAALQASKPKVNGAGYNGAPVSQNACLHCRDFSAPDNHAAQFPRESLAYQDIGWLAEQLTAPFPSLTDKARAIFTWLHHNVAYDVEAFFGNNVRPSTPQKTLTTGLAVCEGYAGLFSALALKAGLEAMVVSGASKGYGHSHAKPDDPLPPYESSHAWNAVKLDTGEWKLIDCCWGAGVVQGPGQPYKKVFAPKRFTQSNNDFGLDHFPGEAAHQFRTDGRTLTYEEFARGNKNGCGAFFWSGVVTEEGFVSTSFQPVAGALAPAALAQQGIPSVRFSFQRICPHWDPVRCGPGLPYVYVLHLDAWEGSPKQRTPFETNGQIWWCDVPVRELGQPGQSATIWAVAPHGDGDGRGVSVAEYRQKKGRTRCGFKGVCKWEIV